VQFSVGAVVEPKRKRLIGVQDLGLGRRRLYKHTWAADTAQFNVVATWGLIGLFWLYADDNGLARRWSKTRTLIKYTTWRSAALLQTAQTARPICWTC